MENQNAIERAKAARAEKEARASVERQKFADQRDETAIQAFYDIVGKFVSFADSNDYSGMHIVTLNGEEYVALSLYDYTFGDGEAFYTNTPLSIAINAKKEVSFYCSGEPSGHPISRGIDTPVEPIPMQIATNLEEYRALPSEYELPYSQRHTKYTTDTMMTWASHLLYYMYDQQQKKLGKRGELNLYSREETKALKEDLVRRYFPDGFDYYEYKRNTVPGYVFDPADYNV